MTTQSSSDIAPETDTTSKVLDAAQRLFLQDGYAGVNLDRIAKAAGVARQTLYNRFGSKESVFRAMVYRHWSKLQAGHSADLADGDPHSAESVLRRFAEAIVEFVDDTDQVAFIRLVIAESRRLPWVAEEFYRAGKEPLLRALVGQLDELHANGLLECDSAELAAHQFFGLLQEVTLWPQVMGVSEFVAGPPAAVVIDETIAMFMARYSPPSA